MNRLFETVFCPGNRTGRFQEPQAVEAANALILLISEFFCIDLSIWKNSYTADNSVSRSHLLCCLDTILAHMENQKVLPVDTITDSLNSYMENIASREEVPAFAYPKPLYAMPCHQTEHFVGRKSVTASLVDHLISGHSCYLHGIGGIGKTEIAKAALKQILATPSSVSGFTHVMWVNYTDGNFALSLIRAMDMADSIHNIDQAFQKAVSDDYKRIRIEITAENKITKTP